MDIKLADIVIKNYNLMCYTQRMSQLKTTLERSVAVSLEVIVIPWEVSVLNSGTIRII